MSSLDKSSWNQPQKYPLYCVWMNRQSYDKYQEGDCSKVGQDFLEGRAITSFKVDFLKGWSHLTLNTSKF